MIALRWGIIETVGHGAVKIRLRGRGSKPGSRNWCLWWLFAEKVSRSFWVSKRFQSSPNFSRFTLPPTIMEMKNGSIWKVTSLCMFFLGTHFWLPQDGYITILPPSNITSLAACWTFEMLRYLEGPEHKESNDDLMLCVSATNRWVVGWPWWNMTQIPKANRY